MSCVLLSSDQSLFEQVREIVPETRCALLMRQLGCGRETVVLVDLCGAKEEALEMVAEVRAIRPFSHVVALVDHASTVAARVLEDAGANQVLGVPLHAHLLEDAVQRAPSSEHLDSLDPRIARDLQVALQEGQLHLHYQARVDAVTRKPRGFEALMRWQHPELGNIPPVHFIPLAETTGAILEMGEWALLEACRQACAWDASGLEPTRIAVNLSPAQFRSGTVVASVEAALQSTGLAPERLELEFTESLMAHDPEEVTQQLHQLKALGVQLSIDDFGTGYSSLSYLRQFPVDAVKIDKAFVDDVVRDPSAAAIVTAIVVLGQSLGHHLVAEGVENERQYEFLRVLGVDELQGYLFSKPLPPEDVVERFGAGAISRAI